VATSAVLGSLLGLPLQERYQHYRESKWKPSKYEGAGASLLWGEADRSEAAQPEKGEDQLRSHPCLQIPEGRQQIELGQGLLLGGAQCQDKRHKLEHRRVPLNTKSTAVLCRWQHWHRLPRGCRVSFLEVSRSHLAVGLGTLLWVALLELGMVQREPAGPAWLRPCWDSGYDVKAE